MSNILNRRTLLSNTGSALLLSQFSIPVLAKSMERFKSSDRTQKITENNGDWKTWKIITKLAPIEPVSSVLLPLPRLSETTYQNFLDLQVKGNFESTQIVKDSTYGAAGLITIFSKNSTPTFELELTVQTRNRIAPENKSVNEDVGLYLKATKNMPTEGLVKQTAKKIVQNIKNKEEQAFAIYNWIIDNTFRDPNVKGCGLGDINNMLATGNLGGKCADINSLFVGLCRSMGIPAREVYGIRVGDSEQYKSIGKSGIVSKAQHCRAEFFNEKKGWIAVDPADVRKVILEEKLKIEDPKIQELRKKFFGFWEMNWVNYNNARDFKFSQIDKEFNYLMYPQSIGANLNNLNPDEFKYSIEVLS